MKSAFKSIYLHLALMFVGLLLINFFIMIATLREITIKPSAKQFAEMINNQLQLIQPLLQNQDTSHATDIIDNLLPNNEIVISKDPEANSLPTLEFYNILSAELKQTKNRQILMQDSEKDPRLWIKDQSIAEYWLGFKFQAYSGKITDWVILIFLATMLMSLIAAYLFSRYMLKPFKQLAKMTEDIVAGQPTTELTKINRSNEVNEISQLVEKSALQIQKLNKEKEMLLAGVSHDLRTPLARMRLQAEFLSDTEIQTSFIQEIEEMDQIIGDFVSFVRSGVIEEFETVELISLINESIHGFNQTSQDIKFSAPESKLMLNLKPISMKRVLNNLFENAFKYGKPPVEVELFHDHKKIHLSIRDHGDGVQQDQLANIFSAFVMAESKNNQHGSGLGLAIVEKLLEQNNATISVQNHENGGLQFSILFNTQMPL
jgi:two-component system osmolarity sensor histidine kinase EnvZ